MMRLICPNCEAQYEVSDDAIPPGGRDVQCSNCQLSWFQTEKPTVPGREAMQLTTPVSEAPKDETPPADDDAPAIDAAEASDEPETPKVPETPDTSDEDLSPAPQRKPLDDAVASILREEASRGTPAAAAIGSAAASAPAKPPATEAARRPISVAPEETLQRIAQMTEEEGGTRTGTAPAKGPAPASSASADEAHLRTVPSINEINATLRARAQANDTSGLTEDEKEEAVKRRGFRRGFFWVLFLLAILFLPYVFADQITENLPQTTEFMASYVATVDSLRLALDDMISGLTAE